ncbi:FecR family protein [Chitinophaga sp.]|uniref:FecR family protein n=1 Tax=Chitinophaga sp. TaxID=1869181 RepID=UPI00262BB4CC|nr:FecR domain-containing protein [uncultured Chitinophaga sp.]
MGEHPDLYTIVQHLQAPEDPAARAALEAWLQSDAGNEAIFREYERIWTLSAGIGELSGIDAEAAARRFRARLPQARTARLPWRRIAAAAAAALLISAGLWYWNSSRSGARFVRFATAGAIDSVVLEDGSRIVLKPRSEIRYNQRREVMLDSGAALFDVRSAPSQPFTTYAGGAKVEVLGTAYNLASVKGQVQLYVLSGAVHFGPEAGHSPTLVSSGKGAVYLRAQQRVEMNDRLGLNATSWRTGELRFVDASMQEVCETLSAQYGVTVVVNSRNNAHPALNANFSQLTLDEVLQSLSALYDYQYERRNDTIYIR